MKDKKTRRVWSRKEEDVLVNSLKELCVRGWKCETGAFKSGYTLWLEKAMLEAFPKTDLRATPHIESKLRVWKKQYTLLASMLATGSFSWDDTFKCVTFQGEGGDDVWESILKRNPKAKEMIRRSYPRYFDWKDIFGEIKSTDIIVIDKEDEDGNGVHEAGEYIDAAISATENDTDIEKNGTKQGSERVRSSPEDHDHIDASMSLLAEPLPDREKPATKKTSKKMRFSADGATGDLATITAAFISFAEKTEERLSQIAQRVGYETEMAAARRELYPALCKLPDLRDLRVEDKLKAADRLGRDPHRVDIFFSLPDEVKVKMVTMLLDGRM